MDRPSQLNRFDLHSSNPNTGHASVLANANDVRIKDSNFNITTNVNTDTKSTLQVLYKRVAPNAILNDGGRADDAKCLPGTREEIIDLIEKWAGGPDSNRILWLSGPAGGGKTAIIKTITERAAKRGVHTINFFFFRGDSSRQSIQPVVPTLLYQLFRYYPHAAKVVAEIVSLRPRIFDESIAQQCHLISALFPVIRQSLPAGTPIVLLVDGLDECDVDADRSQGDILRALEGLLMEDNSPFRLLVASRPEARIKMAFNQLSLRAQAIFLDGQYRPEKDIKRFVVAEFDRIKACHPSAHLLPPNWPLSSDIEGIVAKSSGQFIFAATVMRYIAHASTVPSLSLERVKGIVAAVNNSPFMHLDTIYMFILSRVDDLEAVLAMFSLEIVQHNSPMKWLSEYYNSRYTLALVQSCVSELSAIVKLAVHNSLTFYHASFPDFLVDKARSGKYWLDLDAFRAKMLERAWNKPSIELAYQYSSYSSKCLQLILLQELGTPTTEVTQEICKLPLPTWVNWNDGTPKPMVVLPGIEFVTHIQRLYYNKKEHAQAYYDIIFQCTGHWAQFLARHPELMNYKSLCEMQYRFEEYLEYLIKGGVAEWVTAAGNSKVIQYGIVDILGLSAVSPEKLPDCLGALYLKYQWTSKKHNTKVVQRRNKAVPPTKRGTGIKVTSPQSPPLSSSLSASAPRAPRPSASKIQRVTTSLTNPNIRVTVTKAPVSESPQLPRAHGSKVTGTADASPTRASHDKPSRSPARKPSQAVSRSTGMTGVRSVIAAARSSSDTSSATRPTGHTPPKASPSGGVETQTTPSSTGFLGVGTTSTPGGMRGKSREREDGASKNDDKDSTVTDSRSAVVKASTSVNGAPRLSSRSHSTAPPSRSASSLQVNAREKGATRPGARVWRG